jgi:serine/threonine-protein kinase
MADDERILELVAEVIDSNLPPEEVCADSPELLAEVRACLKECQAVSSIVEDLFPATPAAEDSDLRQAGARLPKIPDYEVLEELGRGGVGVIYRARHVKLNRLVALKMLLSGEFAGPAELARFMREARAVAALQNPNVVQIHDVGEVDGRPYFTMELVSGGSLAAKLGGVPQSAPYCASVTEILARAVHVAHMAGIVHRDIKPGNILLASDGTPKVSDFGLARHFEGLGDVTLDTARIGTPSYMPPEQVVGKSSTVGPAADVYALGATLYEMLAGRPPFRGETAVETERQLLTREPVRPSQLNARVPRDLETICMKCLQKEPQHRYGNALELADDLRRYQRGEPIAARPVSRPERVARWARRNPARAALILTALALLGLGAVAGANRWRLQIQRRAEIAKWAPRLELVEQLERKGQFQEARSLLESRPNVDVDLLNNQIRGALAQLDLAHKLDQIRLNRVAVVDGRFDLHSNRVRSDREYESALREAGFGSPNDTPPVFATRIQKSPVQTALVAALDDWAVCTDDQARRRWIFDVARLADPDPNGWRDRVRDPILSGDALAKLADATDVQDESVQILVALAQRMQGAGVNPIAFLERVERQYPGDFWACFTLAEALWDKQLAECIRYYQAALAIRPETAVAHHNVARALANAGRINEAIEHFRDAVRIEPKFAYALGDLGMALSAEGQYSEALTMVRRAVALDESSAREHAHLGNVLDLIGRTDEAIVEARRAITLEPQTSQWQCSLGSFLMHANRHDEAMEHLARARSIDPKSGRPHLVIGQLLQRQKRFDGAIAEYEAAIVRDDQLFGAYRLLGDCWAEKHAWQNAVLAYDRALALRPDDTNIIRARRDALMQLGVLALESIRTDWATVLKATPLKHDDWYGYAELCLFLGHKDEYERACRELLDRFESSAEPQVWERVGRACLLGPVGPLDAARATALIERAVRVDLPPEQAWVRPFFRIAQGLARYRNGDFDGAPRAIDAGAAAVHGPLPHLVLAMAYRRAGRADEAYRSFANAVSNFDWDSSRADNRDAWIYHVMRREAEPLVMPNLAALLKGKEQPRCDNERLALIAVFQSTHQATMAARLFAEMSEPRNNDDRLARIAVCKSMRRITRAVSLYSDAFSADPDFASIPGTSHRYNAACCAARAAAGDGDDSSELNQAQRAALRERARMWLSDELVAKRSLLAGPQSEHRIAVPGQLETWFTDPALASVRDDGALRKLPSAERDAWLALWRDARSLHDKAKPATTQSANDGPLISVSRSSRE